MPHIIILDEIDAQQGENTTGTGILETLKTRVEAAHQFVEQSDKDNPVAVALEAKMDEIETAVTSGYTSASLSQLSDELDALMP